MKKLLFLIAVMCIGRSAYAQNEVCFSYDAAGNRVQRSHCCSNCRDDGATDPPAEQSAANRLRIAPNPTAGIFTVSTDLPADADVAVYDLSGRMCLVRKLGDGRFDLSEFPPGTYVVQVVSGSDRETAMLEKSNR